MIDLSANHLKILLDIISHYNYEFYAYGSRVKNTARSYSDLDICIKGNPTLLVLSELREKFEESNIPFKIDLVAYQSMTPDFRALVEPDFIDLKKYIKSPNG